MKKGILAVILIISAVFCAFGQNTDTIDLILLLDTSSAMGSSYEKVNDYITGTFLSEFLRTGDTFHLITFSASPRLDIARRISARGDVETIVGRMLIQYPVETGSNASAAVNYVEAYISTLPPRPKKIVMVSAGGTEINNVVSAAKQRLGSKNATLDFVSITGGQSIANTPSSGRPSPNPTPPRQSTSSGTVSGGAASTRTTGGASTTPSTGTASTQGTSGAQTTTQSSSQTGGAQSTQTTTQGTTTQGGTTQGGAQTATQPPASSGTASTAQETSPSDDRTAAEQSFDSQKQDSSAQRSSSGVSSDTYKQKEGISFNPTLPLIIGIIAALLLLILLIVFASRRLGSSPNRVMASVSALGAGEKDDRFADHSRDLASYAANQSKKRVTPYSDRPVKPQVYTQPTINPSGPLLLNLFVEDQNTAIGKRNIHSLKSGYSLSVGGSKSDDFIIFLVPLPSHLGEIRRNGSQLTFIPRKPKYFPDIGTNEVRDCINKKIRVISDKNYEMWFSFVMYEDPLIALNRVLHSIKVPG